MDDLISRQDTLKAMWRALYEYEDKTEKQFQESKDLDVSEWIMNDRLWVQNGHNLCINVVASMPSAQPEIIRCKECKHRGETPIADGQYWCDIHDTFMYYCSDAERRTDG